MNNKDILFKKFVKLLFYPHPLNGDQIKLLNNTFKAMRTLKIYLPTHYLIDGIEKLKCKKSELLDIINSAENRLSNIHIPKDVPNSKSIENRFAIVRLINDVKISGMLQYSYKSLHNNIRRQSRKSLKSINLQRDNVENDVKNDIFSDFIAILGIFTAITFATFGGLQLLGHIFNKVGTLNHVGLGKVISVSSIYLFGVYLILILLFNGISRLTSNDKYTFSPGLNFHLISSFLIIFIMGFVYSYPYVKSGYSLHLQYGIIGIILIIIILIINFFLWLHLYNKDKKNKVKKKNHKNRIDRLKADN